jgi:hypothetical protein
MNTCLPESDLRQLGNSLVSDFDQRIASIPQDLCVPFNNEASRLEAELLMIHKFVVLCVRKEEDLDAIASRWKMMVDICDNAAAKLKSLKESHPYCGAESYFDKILELRAKCQRLQVMHS